MIEYYLIPKMKNILAIIIPAIFAASCSSTPQDAANADSVADTAATVRIEDHYFDTVYEVGGNLIVEIRSNDTVLSRSVYERQSDTFYYPNGAIRHVVAGPSADFDAVHYEYYMNGQLKEKRQQGTSFGCGNAVGEELHYDSTGILLSKTEFDHFLPDSAYGCHDTRTIMTTTEYYPNKKPQLIKRMVTAYEAGIECPCGTWEYYNESGLLIKTVKYSACKKSNLDCEDPSNCFD